MKEEMSKALIDIADERRRQVAAVFGRRNVKTSPDFVLGRMEK